MDTNELIIACNENFLIEFNCEKEDILNTPLSELFTEKQALNTNSKDPILLKATLKSDNSVKYKFNVSPILISKSETGFFVIGESLKISKDWDDTLHQILEGTYNEVGGDFFKSITQELAKTLGMKYAYIGKFSGLKTNHPKVNTVTFWEDTKFKTNFNYDLEGTPCKYVINRKQLLVSDNISELYPKDLGLSKLGVKSYIGTPIFNKDGTPMGIVVVMDTKPFRISAEQAYKLNLFANRIGTEMEWVLKDEDLIKQEKKHRTILKSLPNPVYVQDNDGIFEACNDAFLDFFKINTNDIINIPIDKVPSIISENPILSSSPNANIKGLFKTESTLTIAKNTTKEVIVIKSPLTDNKKQQTGIVGIIHDISEIKEAEKKIQLNEEKYRTLFNTANDAFLLMSNDTFIDCNPKALEMFGCKKEKLIGSSPQLFSPVNQPDNVNSTTKALQKINEALNGKSPTFYWKHKKYNGDVFDAEVSLNAFHIKDELLVQAIVRDVSDNVIATKDIEKQSQRMEKMYELTSDTDTPIEEKLTNILKMATESLGMQVGGISKVEDEKYKLLDHYSQIEFSSDDINYLSQTYCSITIKENRLIAVPNFSNSIYSKSDVFKLLQFESYIGVPYWVKGELRGTIWFTSFYHVKEFKTLDSDFVQIIAQWIGSTIEREEYEESLRKNEALLESLLREIPIDFSVRDVNLKMIWQSNHGKKIWGNNEGRNIDFSDVNEESANKWKDIFKRVLEGETIRGENSVKIYGKSYIFYSIASPIKVKGKVTQVIIIHIDISQLKKADKKLKSRNNKLKKLNTELDRFVYSASHDLRAPLASLLGLIDLSQREELNPALSQYLQLMNTSIVKLDSFISDITDYSRNLRLKTKIELIDFSTFVNDIYNGLAFMNPDKMNFSLKISGQDDFYSDPDRLKLILNNLLSNSIRYRSLNHALKIKVSIKKESDKVEIILEDNGLGIQKEYQTKVFEMFYRANDQNTGSGLGLFIVKETMDKLKGKIELESTINKGTIFKLTIPNSQL